MCFMANSFTLSLIRHAKTQGNIEKRYVGWTDQSIVERELPVINAEQKIVYGSDLKRCRQSAAYYYPQADFRAIAEFRESNFGDYELATYEDLKNNKRYRQWIDDAEHNSPPNGETLAELKKRVRLGLQKIVKEPHCHLVLHGGSIRAILVQFSPTPSQFWDWQVGHSERYELTFESFENFKEGKRCISLSVEPTTVNEIM